LRSGEPQAQPVPKAPKSRIASNASSLPTVWFYVGMAGAFCFILIQLVLLIDFAHSWNESWVEKMEEGNSRCWYAGTLTAHTHTHVFFPPYIIS